MTKQSLLDNVESTIKIMNTTANDVIKRMAVEKLLNLGFTREQIIAASRIKK